MQTRKTKKIYIFPRKIDIINEAELFQDKLQLKEKNAKDNLKYNNRQKNFFLKEKEIQENSINEEDDYNLNIYNNSISQEEDFLIEFNDKDKYKTIQVNNYLKKINSNNTNFNNKKKYLNNNNKQKFFSTSIELYNSLNLKSIEDNDKKPNKNINYLINNINIFKMVHKKRKDIQLLNQILSKENKRQKNMIELKNSKYFITNKYSKKYVKKYKKNINNGIKEKHSRIISQQFNGPYLRKNNITQINSINNSNKNIMNYELKNISNLKDKENQFPNLSEIRTVTKSLFNRYSQIDTNVCDQKINIVTEKNDKNKDDNRINKNKKIKIITSSFNKLGKNDSIPKINDCSHQKESNYIFNLKFYNIYNNNQSNNLKIKSKSNSMLNEYSSFDENYIIKNEKNIIKKNEKLPKNKIFKKRVIFEEEYIIDSNGNQKFLCVKRIADDNNKTLQNAYNTKEFNTNKRSFTSNNLLIPSNNINLKKNQIKNNSKNNSNTNYNIQKKRRLEAKTVFCSPQISYENIFSPSNNLTKSYGRISDIKSKKKKFLNNNSKIKDKKDKKDFPNSQSCIFKYDENIKFHIIDNYNNKNQSKIINAINYNNKNEEKNKIVNECGGVGYEKNILSRKQLKTKIENEKAITINNSRNYKGNNFKNINELNSNKEKYIFINTTNNETIKKDNLYSTTIFENNKIYLPLQKISNISARNNFKYHEIKSVSKEKVKDNRLLNLSNKKQNIHFYFENQNKFKKIFPSTSVDNIKKDKKLYSKFDNSYKFQKNLIKNDNLNK